MTAVVLLGVIGRGACSGVEREEEVVGVLVRREFLLGSEYLDT